MDLILSLLPNLLASHPQVLSALALMGGLRLVMKPLFAFLHAVADIVPGDKDNAMLAKVENSKGYSIFAFVLDWFSSVKLVK